MKKMILAGLCTLTTAAAIAAPIDPMDYYTPDNLDERTLEYVWNNMTTDLRGKDCYRRAQIWVTGMKTPRGQQVKAKKIFIHYTQKFNRVLDSIEDENRKYGSSKIKTADGKRALNRAEAYYYKKNITWDYHVAPLVEVDGVDVVLDKNLPLPYDMEMPYTGIDPQELDPTASPYRLKQTVRQSSIDEWLEALTYRGEMLWVTKRKMIQARVNELSKKIRKPGDRYDEKVKELQREYLALEMDKQEYIDIKCEQITSMGELDAKHDEGWCYYSIVPMYYYNEIDLRNLSYGITNFNHVIPLPTYMNTPENNERGKQYIQHDFNPRELKDALKEITEEDTKAKYKRIYERMKEALED